MGYFAFCFCWFLHKTLRAGWTIFRWVVVFGRNRQPNSAIRGTHAPSTRKVVRMRRRLGPNDRGWAHRSIAEPILDGIRGGHVWRWWIWHGMTRWRIRGFQNGGLLNRARRHKKGIWGETQPEFSTRIFFADTMIRLCLDLMKRDLTNNRLNEWLENSKNLIFDRT